MKKNRATRRQLRGNPLLREHVHDPYRARLKLRERTQCPECGVQFRNGRWVWPEVESAGLKSQLCPACQRISDDYPAGMITLSGGFLMQHRDEILATLRHVGELERNQHPLHRIAAIEEDDESITVTTTDIHLPHRIGHALRDAYGGTMKTQYDYEGYFARVGWERDA